MTDTPEIAVVVASKDRPIRLRWLLNALQEQTLADDRWEVVVAHDSTGPETEELLRTHPLAEAGTLRHLTLPPSPWSAGKLRNAGWRATSAPVIAFTDDDCRPPAEWVERALDAAREHPGAIVQGRTADDPEDKVEWHGPHVHHQAINPPVAYAQTCNIVYPRALLEEVSGFVEEPPLSAGEDTDLALRAQKQAGAEYVGDPEVLTYHAIQAASLPNRVRSLWRWGDLAWLVKRHPEMRGEFHLNLFWKRTHVWLPLALAGLVLGRRNPLWLALAAPWVAHSAPHHGSDPNGRLREMSELPGRLVHDSVEMAALARGSVKHRSLLL